MAFLALNIPLLRVSGLVNFRKWQYLPRRISSSHNVMTNTGAQTRMLSISIQNPEKTLTDDMLKDLDLSTFKKDDLKKLLHQRGCKVSGTKIEMVSRLKTLSEYDNLKISELKVLLRERGLSILGRKADLIARLKEPQSFELAHLSSTKSKSKSESESLEKTSKENNKKELKDFMKQESEQTNNNNNKKKMNFLDLSFSELNILLQQWGYPSYRAKQLWNWVTDRGCWSFNDMSNVPLDLRNILNDNFKIGSLSIAVEQKSRDGTVKRAYSLKDGQQIESVLMPYNDGRRTACVSSQAGCSMGCTFCATGQMGFARHLTSSEIYEQAAIFHAELKKKGERLSNVVLMGMGEPLANYDNVLSAVRRMNTELGIGARHITISTVGLVPKIRQLAKEKEQFTLAVSLHEADDFSRSKIMPINKRFPIPELIDACEEYVEATGRRISFEWALINNVNDNVEVASRLADLLSSLRGKCHVNLIPLNPTGGFEGKPSNKKAIKNFISVLENRGISATSRVHRGIDIAAGCGQLTQRRKKADDLALARELRNSQTTAQTDTVP